MQPSHARILLTRETAHLGADARQQVAAMLWDASIFAEHLGDTAAAIAVQAIAVKLLTLHEGAERWVRLLVARAALDGVAGQLAA